MFALGSASSSCHLERVRPVAERCAALKSQETRRLTTRVPDEVPDAVDGVVDKGNGKNALCGHLEPEGKSCDESQCGGNERGVEEPKVGQG